MLEVASSKIDRFGWGSMDTNVKDVLKSDWCDRLERYTLLEVRNGIAAVFEAAKGRLRSINEFEVEAAIKAQHRRDVAALPVEQQPDEATNNPTDEEKARVNDLVRKAFPSNRGGRQ